MLPDRSTPAPIRKGLCIASVVTIGIADEYLLLRNSFNLIGEQPEQWLVCCDKQSLAAVSRLPRTICTTFAHSSGDHSTCDDASFRAVVAQKMNAIDSAWSLSGIDWVLLLDADMLATRPFLADLALVSAEIVLTPNYYHRSMEHLQELHGVFNSGFIMTRSRSFSSAWRAAFESSPELFTDQRCLNEVVEGFDVAVLGRDYNIGFWRSQEAWETIRFNPLPKTHRLLHVHFLQGLGTRRQLVNRLFGLHCLHHLETSGSAHQVALLNSVLAADLSGWYRASLRLSPGGTRGMAPSQ